MPGNQVHEVYVPMRRTYVTGLWLFANNAKHSPDHYFSHLPATFALLNGHRLVFHYDDDVVMETALDLAKEYRIALEPIRAPVQGLPGWEWADRFADACEAMRLDEFSQPDDFAREKGVVHYWRDLQKGGREPYRRMLAIWFSKIPLIAELARRDAIESIAWVDASIGRFNNTRENWNFSHVESVPGCISHYSSLMRFYGRGLPLNASYLEGDYRAWESLNKVFIEMLPSAARMPYGHDEETVLGQCVKQAPDLFHCIGQPLPHQPRTLRRLLLNLIPRILPKK